LKDDLLTEKRQDDGFYGNGSFVQVRLVGPRLYLVTAVNNKMLTDAKK